MGGYLDLYDLTNFFSPWKSCRVKIKNWIVKILGGFVVQKKSGQWAYSGMSHYANTHQVLRR